MVDLWTPGQLLKAQVSIYTCRCVINNIKNQSLIVAKNFQGVQIYPQNGHKISNYIVQWILCMITCI